MFCCVSAGVLIIDKSKNTEPNFPHCFPVESQARIFLQKDENSSDSVGAEDSIVTAVYNLAQRE